MCDGSTPIWIVSTPPLYLLYPSPQLPTYLSIQALTYPACPLIHYLPMYSQNLRPSSFCAAVGASPPPIRCAGLLFLPWNALPNDSPCVRGFVGNTARHSSDLTSRRHTRRLQTISAQPTRSEPYVRAYEDRAPRTSLRPGSHGLRFSRKKESYRHSFLYLKGGSGSLNPPSVQIPTSGAQAKPPPDLEIRRHTRISEHTAPLGLSPAQGMRKERRRICTFLGHPSNGSTPQHARYYLGATAS